MLYSEAAPGAKTLVFSDNSTQDLTQSVTWNSSGSSIATISNALGFIGLATSRGPGSATITAAMEGISGSTTLTVTGVQLVSISVTPSNPAVALGTDQQFTATGVFSDNSTQDLTQTVTWSSSDPSVASISNAAGSRGVASSVGTGSTTVTAMQDGISGSTTLTVTLIELVSIKVTPENPFVPYNTSIQFTATGSYTDGSQQDITKAVTWSSSNTSIATISNASGSKGLARTASRTGTTTITASMGSISGSTLLTDP